MRVVFFSQRLDAAPFVRGVRSELRDRDCDVAMYDGPPDTGLEPALDGADLVVVQDGIPSNLVDRLGTHRIRQGRYRLLFHDRHPAGTLGLAGFDGILAASDAIRESYVRAGWSRTAWTWHDAADTSVFRPLSRKNCAGDVVWIADWVGADWGKWDHTSRLFEFLLDPVKDLDLRLRMYGADFPKALQAVLRYREVECDGPLANERIPEIFAAFRATVQLSRCPDPALRVLEALACGIPLVSAPWDDPDHLFTAG